MDFQIFIPGADSAEAGLTSVGLRHLAVDVTFSPLRAGPDGQPGVLCSWIPARGRPRVGYQPDQQEWIPAIAQEDYPAARYWVGFWKDSPPSPEVLRRPYPYMGSPVRLDDGNEWIFPRVESIPMTLVRQDDGSTAFLPQRRLSEYVAAAELLRPVLNGLAPGAQTTWSGIRDVLEMGLNANYRLTPEVCDRLKLWSHTQSGTIWRAIAAILEIQPIAAGGE